MANKSSITKEQVLAAARVMVEDAVAFWELAPGLLTFEQVIEKVDPTSLHPTIFRAAVEQLASGLAGVQQRAIREADPPPDPTEQEREDAAWAEYEARVASETDPDQLAAIVAENEELLAEEAQAERAEINRRAERQYFLREEDRKARVSPQVGYVQEDKLTNTGDQDLPPRPERTGHAISEMTPEECYERWVREGRKVPRADDK